MMIVIEPNRDTSDDSHPECRHSPSGVFLSSQDRDTQKMQWIDRFIEELRTNDKWVIPALKQIREICSLFGEAPQNLR